MQIDDKLIDHLSHLARLEFSGNDKVEIKKDLENILSFCEKLNAVNTDGVEPLIYMNTDTNRLREDEIKNQLSREEALLNAPSRDSDFFRVPKFIEK